MRKKKKNTTKNDAFAFQRWQLRHRSHQRQRQRLPWLKVGIVVFLLLGLWLRRLGVFLGRLFCHLNLLLVARLLVASRKKVSLSCRFCAGIVRKDKKKNPFDCPGFEEEESAVEKEMQS